MIVDYDDCSLILLPDASLANTVSGASRVLSAMVEEMLSTVKSAAVVQVELDALVREAKRLSDDKGEKMSDDNIRAFNLFLRAAVARHSEAQFHVFRCFKSGRGIEENLTEAERWLRKAAEAGNQAALFILGVAYTADTADTAMLTIIAKDEEEAIKCLHKVAEKGGSIGRNACLFMCNIYKERNNDTEELRWMKEAALRGYTDSFWDVKRFYEQQEVTRMELPEAYAWLLLFADHSNSETKAQELEARMSLSQLERANQLYRDYTKKRNEWEQREKELRNLNR